MNFRLVVLGVALSISFLVCGEDGQARVEGSSFSGFVTSEEMDRRGAQQYAEMLMHASSKNALGPDDHPQVIRLRRIAQRLIPIGQSWNASSRRWKWEVNLLGYAQVNAFCFPGGKIAIYSGTLNRLQLNDDEIAIVLGHEIAHALREHARSRVSHSMIIEGAASFAGALASIFLGVNSQFMDSVAGDMGNLLTLKFTRDDEIDADLLGMEIAALAGYDPRAAISLWKKMSEVNANSAPQWLSTHPASESRIEEIRLNLPRVLLLYQSSKNF